MSIKELPDECSNCGCELEDYYECPSCGAPLCNSCVCLCGIESESKKIEKEFEVEDDDLITKLEDSIKVIKKKEKRIDSNEDEWVEIRNIPIIKETEKEDEI